jgi:ketosteroid isomerase-like protein
MSQAAVLAAERSRCAAFVARDAQALAATLHDDVVYVHATGVCHDRDGLLAFVTAGPRFLRVELLPSCVELRGDVAIVTGTLALTLQRAADGPAINACSWASAVWLRDAQGWRLRLFQSTKKESGDG